MFTLQPVCLPGQVPATAGRGSVAAAAPSGVSLGEDGGRYYSTKRGAFHEVFNLPESERPLTGEGGTAVWGPGSDGSFCLTVLFLFSLCCHVRERLALLPHQQRPEDTDRLHPQRSPLHHRKVSP